MKVSCLMLGVATIGLLSGCGAPVIKNGRIAIAQTHQVKDQQSGQWSWGQKEIKTIALSRTGKPDLPRSLTSNPNETGSHSQLPLWSPDGQRLAVITNFALNVIEGDGSRPLRLVESFDETAPEEKDIRWSPDGKWLAYALNGTLTVVTTDGTQGVTIARNNIEDKPRYYVPLGWSKDGKSLVFFEHDASIKGAVTLYRVPIAADDFQVIQRGKPPQTLPKTNWQEFFDFHVAAYEGCQMHVNQRQVACVVDSKPVESQSNKSFSINRDVIEIVSIDDGKSEIYLPDKVTGLPKWSPDGKWVAFEANDDNMTTTLWTMPTHGWGNPRKIIENPQAWQWSPDSKRLLFAPKAIANDGVLTGQGLFTANPDGSARSTMIAPGKVGESIGYVSWQPVWPKKSGL